MYLQYYWISAIYISTVFCCSIAKNKECDLDNPAVKEFREYLRIDTSRPENFEKGADFWKDLANAVGLEYRVYEPSDKPICVLTWPGKKPSLQSIMLNSHMDVVPANENEWSHPPFAAEVDADCNIFARGAQDTKDIAIQYIEAIRRLKQDNVTLDRTIHITVMPDEETGGHNGMRPFLLTDEFKDLNVGFALDEGLSNEGDDLYVLYQDRRVWLMKFTVEGVSGHGSLMLENIAVEKLNRLFNVMMQYRETLGEAVKSKSVIEYGSYTTMNINMINGGIAPNVIPEKFTLVADLRLSGTENSTEMMSVVNSWLEYAGNGTKVEFLRQELESAATTLDDSNFYWTALKSAVNKQGFNLLPIICPATSDMLFVRNHGIPALGFAPKYRTVTRMHDVDEYLNIDVFMRGIDVYVEIIKELGNVPEN